MFVCIPRPSYYLHDIVIHDVIRVKVNRLSCLRCLGHFEMLKYILNLSQFDLHDIKYQFHTYNLQMIDWPEMI